VRQDGAHGFACGALDTPDGEPTQADSEVMRVTCQAPAAATARLVCELKAQGQEESHDAFDTRLAIAKELKVGGFVVKSDGDGPVFAGLPSGVTHEAPQVRWSLQLMTQDGGKTAQVQGDHEGRRGSTT